MTFIAEAAPYCVGLIIYSLTVTSLLIGALMLYAHRHRDA